MADRKHTGYGSSGHAYLPHQVVYGNYGKQNIRQRAWQSADVFETPLCVLIVAAVAD